MATQSGPLESFADIGVSTNSVETVNSIDYDGYYLSELVK